MTTPGTRSLLDLPKAHLHLHLDDSLLFDTDLLREYSIATWLAN